MAPVRRKPTLRGTIIAALAMALALAAVAEPAAAHDPGKGLEVVRPAVGPPLYTHGIDPRPPQGAARPAARAAFGAGVAPRAPMCATSNHLQLIYARPVGAKNRLRRSTSTIRSSMARTNAVLNAESIASGGTTADYKVQCDSSGQIAIYSVVTAGGSFAQIVTAARAAGFTSNAADYMIFYDGRSGSACGTATTYNDDRLSPGNIANQGGGYGVAYAGCWTEETPMHEIGHMMGAVQYSAPHSTGSGGHCVDENDVLCYSPDGGDLNQGGTVTLCAGAPRFDCNFDDYFDAAPEPGEYLATHWNLGSPLNAFIAFGAGAPGGGFTDAVGGLIQGLLEGGATRGSGDGVAGAEGEWRLYDIAVTGGAKTLTVKVSNATSEALTLYLRARNAPSTLAYACKAKVRGGSATCTVPRPRGGPWIAGVRSGAGATGATYGLRARLTR